MTLEVWACFVHEVTMNSMDTIRSFLCDAHSTEEPMLSLIISCVAGVKYCCGESMASAWWAEGEGVDTEGHFQEKELFG